MAGKAARSVMDQLSRSMLKSLHESGQEQ